MATGSFKQPTREQLAARHNGAARTPRGNVPTVRGGSGFSDPGGVVARNVAGEGAVAPRWFEGPRVAGRWPL